MVKLLIYHYDGTSWSMVYGNQTVDGKQVVINGIFGLAANDVYAFGNNPYVLHHDGSSWTPLFTNITTGNLNGIASLWGTS